MQYLTAFRRFSFSLLLSSSLGFSLLSLPSLKYRQVQTQSHTRHSAKQKLLSVCSKRQMSASLCFVPLFPILSQKAVRSTMSPASCIILNAFMGFPSSFCSSSIKVSYLDSHRITLRARMSSLQRGLREDCGWQALQVLMRDEMRRRYLSIFMVLVKCPRRVVSVFCQRVGGLVGSCWGLANGIKSTRFTKGEGCSPGWNWLTSSMSLRLSLSWWSGGSLVHSVSRESLLFCHRRLPARDYRFQKFSKALLQGEEGREGRVVSCKEGAVTAWVCIILGNNYSVILQGLCTECCVLSQVRQQNKNQQICPVPASTLFGSCLQVIIRYALIIVMLVIPSGDKNHNASSYMVLEVIQGRCTYFKEG